jgi:PhnB protein
MALHPYLMFAGNCRDAMSRYQEIFGGELTLLTMGDLPGDEQPPPGQEDLIMHAALMFGGDLLMASDDPTGGVTSMSGIYVSCSVAGADEAERVFAALAEGGKVDMPMEPTFWSPRFGMCTDRFGTPWMVSADQPAES